jgi:hypothetical protein
MNREDAENKTQRTWENSSQREVGIIDGSYETKKWRGRGEENWKKRVREDEAMMYSCRI